MLVDDIKIMTLRSDDVCVCGADLAVGATAGWHAADQVVVCVDCLSLEELDDFAGPEVPRPTSAVAGALLGALGSHARFLFDRRTGSGSTEVLATTSSGVWVVIAPHLDAAVVGTDRKQRHLVVDGRRRNGPVDDLAAARDAVKAAVRRSPMPAAPVRPALCPIGADLGPEPFTVRDLPVLTLPDLVAAMAGDGPLAATQQSQLHQHLDRKFPA